MRYKCGSMLAKRDGDSVHPDVIAGVPDSGIAHAIGYANEAGIPYARPFIKYTPTWPRSFMPQNQSQRNLIARMKLIPVPALIEDKKLLLIDDSIVRGTQLRETTEFLYNSGAKAVSYTHLDVYKRQYPSRERYKQYPSLGRIFSRWQ